MDKQRLQAEVISGMITELHPEFNTILHNTVVDIVERHISYTVAEIAVYQKHSEQKKACLIQENGKECV